MTRRPSAAASLLLSLSAVLTASLPGRVVAAASSDAADAVAIGAPVDLNTADASTLARVLQGVGEARARAIVEHRQRHGAFRSVDELALVRGIGPKTVERNRALLRVGGDAAVGAPRGTSPDGARGAASGASQGSAVRTLPRPRGQGPIIMEGMPR